MPLCVIIASINPVIALFLTVSFPPPSADPSVNVKKSYIPCRDRARAALELCSPLQSAWPGKEQSLFCRDGNDRMEESECASESAQARESEAHFSARLLLPSLYFLRGRKKNGHGKKKNQRVKYRSTLRAQKQKRNQSPQIK